MCTYTYSYKLCYNICITKFVRTESDVLCDDTHNCGECVIPRVTDATSLIASFKMINKNIKTSVEDVYINTKYVKALDTFLSSKQMTTTPEYNKIVTMKLNNGKEALTKFTRPYICFEYNSTQPYLKCFPLGTFKKGKDKLNDQRFYYIVDTNGKILGKVLLTKPIFVPINDIHVFDFKKEHKIAKINKEYNLVY